MSNIIVVSWAECSAQEPLQTPEVVADARRRAEATATELGLTITPAWDRTFQNERTGVYRRVIALRGSFPE